MYTHADFETPGVIETWANQNGYDFIVSGPYKGDHLSEHRLQNFTPYEGKSVERN